MLTVDLVLSNILPRLKLKRLFLCLTVSGSTSRLSS